ncbi:MAG TPA: hypothetical protein VLE99_00705, partial [Candidatus Saccharimonadales bacterium]|nr:hypothetical protein [Candidatus Saccharimonadales bacterium]
FSIAIKAHSDILIFDEVLAVGDEAFQRKCLDVFERYKAEGQTIILVTHDMETVKRFCNRAILVSEGKIAAEGDPYTVANLYSQLNQAEIDREIAARADNGVKTNLQVSVVGADGKSRQSFYAGEKVCIRVAWPGLGELESVGINIVKGSGEHITGYNTRFSGQTKWRQDKQTELEITLNITKGVYHLLVEAFQREGVVAEALIDGPRFSVKTKDTLTWSGLMDLPHRWL